MQSASNLLLEDRRHYVYAHAKATTGEIFYIGKGADKRAQDLRRRSDWHKRVVAKHGCDVHVLERHMTQSEAYAREAVLIIEGREMGLKLVNITGGGLGALGLKPSDETRAKMSKAATGRPGNIGNTGNKMSDEAKARISVSRMGKGRNPRSAETRAKMGARMIGANNPRYGKSPSAENRAEMSARMIGANNPMYGTKMPSEHKEKLRGVNTGKPLNAEHRAKLRAAHVGRDPVLYAKQVAAMRAANIGKNPSEVTRAKMSESAKGRTMSVESRAKISATLRARKTLNTI